MIVRRDAMSGSLAARSVVGAIVLVEELAETAAMIDAATRAKKVRVARALHALPKIDEAAGAHRRGG